MTTTAPDPTRDSRVRTPPSRFRAQSSRLLQRRESRIALLFVLPAFLLFLAFRFGPAIVGVALSLFDYDISGTIEWEGLANFERMLADPVFWKALSVTLLYAVLAVPIGLAISIGLALAVRRAFVGSRFFRSIFFLPVITSLVLAGAVFKWIFSSDGPWSALMSPIGLGGPWLNSPALVVPALVVVGVWSRFGYGMLIAIAALQDIPRELEEAALMDGAGPWNRFRYIVLPHMKPTIFFLLVIETTGAFQIFDLIYVMTQGGPAHSSYSLVYMLYDQGFKYFDYGYAAAIGVALFVMTLIVALIQRALIGKEK